MTKNKNIKIGDFGVSARKKENNIQYINSMNLNNTQNIMNNNPKYRNTYLYVS